jgi:hypothetical protein
MEYHRKVSMQNCQTLKKANKTGTMLVDKLIFAVKKEKSCTKHYEKYILIEFSCANMWLLKE